MSLSREDQEKILLSTVRAVESVAGECRDAGLPAIPCAAVATRLATLLLMYLDIVTDDWSARTISQLILDINALTLDTNQPVRAPAD